MPQCRALRRTRRPRAHLPCRLRSTETRFNLLVRSGRAAHLGCPCMSADGEYAMRGRGLIQLGVAMSITGSPGQAVAQTMTAEAATFDPARAMLSDSPMFDPFYPTTTERLADALKSRDVREDTGGPPGRSRWPPTRVRHPPDGLPPRRAGGDGGGALARHLLSRLQHGSRSDSAHRWFGQALHGARPLQRSLSDVRRGNRDVLEPHDR